MCKIMEGIGRNNEVEWERVLHLKTSMQETELYHYDPCPPPKAIVKERGGAEAQVSLYFPIAHHAELISSQVTYRYFPIESNTTSTCRDAV